MYIYIYVFIDGLLYDDITPYECRLQQKMSVAHSYCQCQSSVTRCIDSFHTNKKKKMHHHNNSNNNHTTNNNNNNNNTWYPRLQEDRRYPSGHPAPAMVVGACCLDDARDVSYCWCYGLVVLCLDDTRDFVCVACATGNAGSVC